MSHDGGQVCPCVTEHRPKVVELDLHHGLPLYLGGLDIESNRFWVCPNTHRATHELLRLYLVNVLEYDLINSYHLHGNLFNYFPTGTSKEPSELTDTVMLCQGQRGILEWRFPSAGKFMFHAHQSEFTELGWQGFFEAKA